MQAGITQPFRMKGLLINRHKRKYLLISINKNIFRYYQILLRHAKLAAT